MKPKITSIIQYSCLVFSASIFSIPAVAQVTADGTTSTTVISPDDSNFIINDGDRPEEGANLFHSFQNFSVPTNGSAYFNNPVEIDNIFSRVTGGNLSNIDGLIRANGAANLFLINPAGIMFGDNARLDLGGSFLGSTADSLLFPEGEFSAVDLTNPPVLTIKAPIGLGFRDEPGKIVNQSVTNNSRGLEVSPEESITLVGGDINLAGTNIVAPGGRVELGGLSSAGIVTINENGSLSFPKGIEKANVTLTNATDVDVTAGGGGSIVVNARDIELSGGELGRSRLRAGIAPASGSSEAIAGDIILNAENNITVSQGSLIVNQVLPRGVGNAGEINIATNNLSLIEGGRVDASTLGLGDAGKIDINASGNILANGNESGIASVVRVTGTGNSGEINIATNNLSLTQGGEVSASTFGQGNAGKITINASGNILVDGQDQLGVTSLISSRVGATGRGNSGGIEIETTDLFLTQGGRVDSSTFGRGNAGKISINASGNILAKGGDESGIITVVRETGVGSSGEINIKTNDLFLRQGGRVDSSTFGVGNAGKISINASGNILAEGGDESGIISIVRRGGLGNAGGIEITTTDLSLIQGGRVSASTFGIGNAGKITIHASGNILAEGKNESGFTSRISSRVGSNAVGNSGGIDITTTNLSLIQGGIVTASTRGQGKAGNLTVKASDSLELVGSNGEFPSGLFANAIQGNGQGGDLNISTDRLIVRDSAVISVGNFEELVAESSELSPPGTGAAGNLEINARLVEVNNQGKITTDNANGIGGNLILNADSLILESEASISASTTADRGQGGNITLNIDDTLHMRDRSLISARADKGANGGNVNINAEFIIAAPNQNNDIIASTSQGMGGNIDITATGIFGLAARSSTPPNNTNDIDASSEFGLDGNITINAPDVGTFQEIIKAPEIAQLQTLGVNACARKEINQASSFTITGKGGVPAKLTEPLNSDRIFIEGESISTSKGQSERVQTEQIKPLVTAQGKIYPARGIVFLENGDIILTPYPTNNLQRTPYSSPNCLQS